MSSFLNRPFTQAEMDAIRRAASGEDGGEHASEAHVRQNFWRALRRIARNTPFAHDLVAAYHCARDPQTPLRVRMILFGALGYFILPLDAVSDLLPLVGFTDDAAVLALAIASVSAAIQPKHREMAAQTLAGSPADAGEPPVIDAHEASDAGKWRRVFGFRGRRY